jgi:hypothetical protein
VCVCGVKLIHLISGLGGSEIKFEQADIYRY